MLWLKKGFGFCGLRSVREQNGLLAVPYEKEVNEV